MDLVAVEGALEVECGKPSATTDGSGEILDAGKRVTVGDCGVVESSKVDAQAVVVNGSVGVFLWDHERVAGPGADAVAADVAIAVLLDAGVQRLSLQVREAAWWFEMRGGIASLDPSVAVNGRVHEPDVELVQ